METSEFDEVVLQQIYTAMVNIDTESVAPLVQKALSEGIDILKIIDALTKGINVVGDKFEALEYFLPELIMVANAMEEAMVILRPQMDMLNLSVGSAGTIVMATIQGDIHDIGRTIASSLMRASGFVVHDLGHDVRADVIIDKAVEFKADVIGLSSLLTTSLPYSRDVIRLLVERNLRDQFVVVMGGGAVTPDFVKSVGADGYSKDAPSGIRMIGELLAGGRTK
jgi:trimethylamine corrinoid protein